MKKLRRRLFSTVCIGVLSCLSIKSNAMTFSIGPQWKVEKSANLSDQLSSSLIASALGKLGDENQFRLGGEIFRSADNSTGQGTLSTRSSSMGVLAVGEYHPKLTLLNPFLSAGVGIEQSTVNTSTNGKSETDFSRPYVAGFGGVGLELNLGKNFSFGTEGRLFFSENQYSPTVWGILFKMNIIL